MSRILYVEDNFQNYRLVMRMLAAEKDQTYEICQAPDGESALRMVGEFQPDLILMDINLPDIDGMEVTRRIRADERLSRIPIIALTANAMVGDRERYMAGGCDGYLRKPFSRAELREVLDQFLHHNGDEARVLNESNQA
jgi:two-component system cell cycle response regulator DivK